MKPRFDKVTRENFRWMFGTDEPSPQQITAEVVTELAKYRGMGRVRLKRLCDYAGITHALCGDDAGKEERKRKRNEPAPRVVGIVHGDEPHPLKKLYDDPQWRAQYEAECLKQGIEPYHKRSSLAPSDLERLVTKTITLTIEACSRAEFGSKGWADWDIDRRQIQEAALLAWRPAATPAKDDQRKPSMLPQSFFPSCGCTLSTKDGRRVYVCPEHAATGCINCGETKDGGYATEDVGAFCSECWDFLREYFESSSSPLTPEGESRHELKG